MEWSKRWRCKDLSMSYWLHPLIYCLCSPLIKLRLWWPQAKGALDISFNRNALQLLLLGTKVFLGQMGYVIPTETSGPAWVLQRKAPGRLPYQMPKLTQLVPFKEAVAQLQAPLGCQSSTFQTPCWGKGPGPFSPQWSCATVGISPFIWELEAVIWQWMTMRRRFNEVTVVSTELPVNLESGWFCVDWYIKLTASTAV